MARTVKVPEGLVTKFETAFRGMSEFLDYVRKGDVESVLACWHDYTLNRTGVEPDQQHVMDAFVGLCQKAKT